MDLVDQLRAFVATAQTGSFTGAATQLRISNRLTSKYVGELEQRLGVRLFQRTTRKGHPGADAQRLAQNFWTLGLRGISRAAQGCAGSRC